MKNRKPYPSDVSDEEWAFVAGDCQVITISVHVERFQRTLQDEFFRTAMLTTFYESVEALQADFDTFLRHYNYERPHRGYRNMGKCPINTLTQARSAA